MVIEAMVCRESQVVGKAGKSHSGQVTEWSLVRANESSALGSELLVSPAVVNSSFD